jgi:hypothetical protein
MPIGHRIKRPGINGQDIFHGFASLRPLSSELLQRKLAWIMQMSGRWPECLNILLSHGKAEISYSDF